MAATDLTAERLWQLLDYYDEEGVFRWRRSRARTAKHNAVAGSIGDEGYVSIMIDGRSHRAHRLAFLYMTGSWPTGEVDHKNTVRSDNRWANLRCLTHQGNTENRRESKNACGLLGVSVHGSGRFRARIRADGKLFSLGLFDTPESAHGAYVAAKRTMHAANTL